MWREIKKTVDQVNEAWAKREEMVQMVRESLGDFYRRKKRVFYDTDMINESQEESVRLCPDCPGYMTITSSAQRGYGTLNNAFCVSIPRGACSSAGRMQKRSMRSIWRTAGLGMSICRTRTGQVQVLQQYDPYPEGVLRARHIESWAILAYTCLFILSFILYFRLFLPESENCMSDRARELEAAAASIDAASLEVARKGIVTGCQELIYWLELLSRRLEKVPPEKEHKFARAFSLIMLGHLPTGPRPALFASSTGRAEAAGVAAMLPLTGAAIRISRLSACSSRPSVSWEG